MYKSRKSTEITQNLRQRIQLLASLISSALLAILMTSCSKQSEVANAAPHARIGQSFIKVSPGVAKGFDLQTQVIEPHNVMVPLHLSGHTEADIGREVDVSVRVVGRLAAILIKPGQFVKKGTILATVDSRQISELQSEALEAKSRLAIAEAQAARELQIYTEQMERPKALLDAQAKLDNANLQAELAESNHKRAETLFREKIAAAKDYMQAKAVMEIAHVNLNQAKVSLAREKRLFKSKGLLRKDYQLAMAEVYRARQQLKTLIQRLKFFGQSNSMTQKLLASGAIDGIVEIAAPIDGVINRFDCAVGEMTRPERELFKLTDLTFIQVAADLPEIYLSKIKLGDQVKVKIAGFSNSPVLGKVSLIGINVNEETRTLPIRARIANPKMQIKTNMFAEVDLESSPKVVLACPKSAIQELDGRTIVFVKCSQGFKEQEIKSGLTGENYVEILSGLSPGDQVATQGSLMLKTELTYSR